MCGIVGVVCLRGKTPDRSALGDATALLHRRGPDASGLWIENAAGLGHRRLSILDLSEAGLQPMVSADDRHVIVFNGEIYNFRELKSRLDPGPEGWRTGTDTEVILAAYARFGRECVHHLDGMFAFAIWDRVEERLFAARDRLGEKPFYYLLTDGAFAFASRPRALSRLVPEHSREVDLQGLRYYLELGWYPAPFSHYRAIRKLPAAHTLTFEQGKLSLSRYWDPCAFDVSPEWSTRGEEDLLDELDEILTRSVRSRMVSDVPLGAFLSGGIDSSLVVSAMARVSDIPVRTFTIGFEEVANDESPWAAQVAQHLTTDHCAVSLAPDDLLGLMPLFQEEFDEPFFDYAAFPLMSLSRLAREHVTVALTGDGGDEFFGGYHYYEILKRLDPVYRLPLAARRTLAGAARALPGHEAKLIAGVLGCRSLDEAFAFMRSVAKDFESVLEPGAAATTRGVKDLFVETAAALSGLAPSERAMRLDAVYTLQDDYLQKVDLASMAYSLEVRAPLLSPELAEWGMRLPIEWKLRNGKNKYLLRKLACRYVPHEVVERPKHGFVVPIEHWLRGRLKPWAIGLCNDPNLYEGLPLVQRRVQELLDSHLSGRRNVHSLLWTVLMLLDFNARRL